MIRRLALKLNSFLKDRLPFLVLFKRLAYRKLNINPMHKIFTDRNYFDSIFSRIAPYNLASLNLREGVAVGNFRNHRYLMRMEPGDHIESLIYLDGIYAGRITNLIHQFLNGPNSVLVVVGANIGAITIPLARVCPDVKFFCFEPHPSVFQRLTENVAINKLQNVTLENAAVSNLLTDTVIFYAQTGSFNRGLSSTKLNHDIDEFDEIEVPQIGIDHYFGDLEVGTLVIKIDTQGNEVAVLESSSKIIERLRPVIFFEYQSKS
jgi:FkbM family methyltransferase